MARARATSCRSALVATAAWRGGILGLARVADVGSHGTQLSLSAGLPCCLEYQRSGVAVASTESAITSSRRAETCVAILDRARTRAAAGSIRGTCGAAGR